MIEKLTPTDTIRAYCLQCMGGQRDFVADCETEDCPCYPFRFGKNPARQGIGGSISQIARELRVQRPESIFSGQAIGSIASS